ncbi:MAG: peptidoglycan-binding domain-containing protein, partial [Actinomycetota bacterium]
EADYDTDFTVDGVFDAATADAVRRWQDDLGVDDTGVVDPSAVVVIDGPATASAVAVERGDNVRAGTELLSLNVGATVITFHSRHAGEFDSIASPGEVANGDLLYVVDDEPVAALLTDDDELVLDRNLFNGVSDGDDVEAVEQLLADLGYDADGDLEVDDTFDGATAEAVEDWQEDLADEWDEVDVDAVIRPADLAVVPTGTVLGDPVDRTSDTVATGSVLFTSIAVDGARIVTTAIDVAEQSTLAEGDTVDIEFPDGATVAGTVTHLATTSTLDPTNPNAEPQLDVEITLSEVPAEVERFSELDVDVLLVDELTAGATVVPASALLATAEGGYAVEVVDDAATGATTLIEVEPGSFTDGFVAVTGITPGTAVVVPS